MKEKKKRGKGKIVEDINTNNIHNGHEIRKDYETWDSRYLPTQKRDEINDGESCVKTKLTSDFLTFYQIMC